MSEQNKLSSAEKMSMVAHKFFNENNIIYFHGIFYLYNDGIWRIESTENTEAWIAKEYLKLHAEPAMERHKKEITKMIQDMTYNTYRKKIKELNENARRKQINIKSGILNLNDFSICSYTKDDFCFYKIPFDYIKEPQCPLLSRFLTSSMGFGEVVDTDDYRKVMKFIQEWMGYTLMPGNPHEKALLLMGRGRNGKGTLLHIWHHILGKENVSTLGLDALNHPQMVHLTRHKLANLSKDSNANSQLDTETIKSAVAGEEVSANPKYIAPYDFKFTAKLIMACNDLPFTKSTDENIRERFYVIPFDCQFTEQQRDRFLKQKLETESEQIFSWAVNGLRSLELRGHFDPPERCIVSLNRYMTDNNSIAMWLEEGELTDPKRRCKRSDAWKDYKLYCEDSKLHPFSKSRFFRQMEKQGFRLSLIDGGWWYNGLKPMINSEYANNPITHIKG